MADSPSPWRIGAASARGVAHEADGLPCQDAHAVLRLPGVAIVAAAADGAGSALYADAGARFAVAACVEALVAALGSDRSAAGPARSGARDGAAKAAGAAQARERSTGPEGPPGAAERGGSCSGPAQALRIAVEAARSAVLAEAARHECPPRELATTLLAAIVTADGAWAAQVGDGAIVTATGDGLSTLTRPSTDGYANETAFLTDDDALERLQLVPAESRIMGVALFTDGLQRLALQMPAATPFAPFLTPLFGYVRTCADDEAASRGIAAFLASPRVRERTEDDLTLVVLASDVTPD